MNDTVKAITDAIEKLAKPAIPVEVDLWDAATIGAYMKRGKQQVLARIVTLPGFPQAIRLPAPNGGRGQPLWEALEVIEWARKHKEKRAA